MHEPETSTEPIEVRIARLEEKWRADEESLVKKYGAWGGVIALTLTILLGFFSISDRVDLFLSRDEVRAAEFKKIAADARTLMLRAAEISAQSGPNAAAEYLSLARVEIHDRLSQLNSFSDSAEKYASFSDALSLSEFHASFSMFEQAKKFATIAETLASNNIEEIYVLNLWLRMFYMMATTESIEKARALLPVGVKLSSSLSASQHDGAIFQIYTSAISAETFLNSCERARQYLSELRDNLLNPVEKFIDRMAAQAEENSNCQIRILQEAK
ncbi:hypothetical protein [Pseudooceanicola sp. LIPI14-2-Ac024]|uniref:hypothetical protein n=1 Tax=Pseudooceanicola sp. LIPI14-2-Ac024 TaxID=3344875 RepID=UPI0035D0D5CE